MRQRRRRRTWLVLASIVLLMAFSVKPAEAGYSDGVLAFEAARYDKALTEFRPLAARGHAGAEFMLGVMNFQGKGVAQNKLVAAIWFHKSASKGHAGAQLAFGSVFIRGIGVYQDISKAFMWLTLAVESDVQGLSQQATNLRDDAKKLMTPSEIDAAQQAARNFKVSPAGLVREN